MKLREILEKMWDAMQEYDLNDEYLTAHGSSTRKDVDFTVSHYGISTVPCDMIYPFLYALATDKRLSRIAKEVEDDPELFLGDIREA